MSVMKSRGPIVYIRGHFASLMRAIAPVISWLTGQAVWPNYPAFDDGHAVHAVTSKTPPSYVVYRTIPRVIPPRDDKQVENKNGTM